MQRLLAQQAWPNPPQAMQAPARQTWSPPQPVPSAWRLQVPLPQVKQRGQPSRHSLQQVEVGTHRSPQTLEPSGQLPLQGRSLARHWPPHSRKPPRQVNPQSLPLQRASALAGGRHCLQAGPQKFVSLGTQLPLQSCLPSGQTPMQGWPMGMHAPAQRVVPEGQRVPQTVPSQVASPPSGAGQGVHELPQLAGSRSERQVSPSHL
jgi:hypothetical protein